MTRETNDATFRSDVLESQVPTLVDFWAPWCGPCRIVGPVIDRVAEKAGEKARVVKMNVDENPATANRYGISAIPTIMVFRNGKVSKQLIGVQPEHSYLSAVSD
jgi:thioredoxin